VKSCSGKKLVAILRRKGWIHLRTKGSHQTFQSPDAERSVTIPIHGNKDLRRGTLGQLLKDTGLTEDDL
jgi:predicted RNA binding protein YcfA (HicA-like mRNA interferase family)